MQDRELRDEIKRARDRPDPERLRERTPDDKGKPEAVNLERDEPVSTGVRRKDSF